MNTFTVCFKGIKYAWKTDGISVEDGLSVTPGANGRPPKVCLGDSSFVGSIASIETSMTRPPVIDNGRIFSAGVFKSQKMRCAILDMHCAAEGVHKTDILVRINLWNNGRIPFPLTTKVPEFVDIICSGSAYLEKDRLSFDDILVVIPSHQGVIISLSDKDDKFVVVNNAGQATVVTMDEYLTVFGPHILAKESDSLVVA